jgi:RNA polymerase sigma factor (sigma-70 family)
MTTPSTRTVFIVDDDPAVRDSLALLLSLHGYQTLVFASAKDFLKAVTDEWAGCIVLDICMPGMGGLELQQQIAGIADRLPIVIITAHGDLTTARAAFRANAVDFLEKPVGEKELLAALDAAFDRVSGHLSKARERGRSGELLKRLTRREQQVLTMVAEGRHNREIAEELKISPRTVEVYRARVMEKLEARSISDLVKITLVGA